MLSFSLTTINPLCSDWSLRVWSPPPLFALVSILQVKITLRNPFIPSTHSVEHTSMQSPVTWCFSFMFSSCWRPVLTSSCWGLNHCLRLTHCYAMTHIHGLQLWPGFILTLTLLTSLPARRRGAGFLLFPWAPHAPYLSPHTSSCVTWITCWLLCMAMMLELERYPSFYYFTPSTAWIQSPVTNLLYW